MRLFYYLLHIPLIHAAVVFADYVRYGYSPYAHAAHYEVAPDRLPAGYGYGLPTLYLV